MSHHSGGPGQQGNHSSSFDGGEARITQENEGYADVALLFPADAAHHVWCGERGRCETQHSLVLAFTICAEWRRPQSIQTEEPMKRKRDVAGSCMNGTTIVNPTHTPGRPMESSVAAQHASPEA